MAYRLLSTLQLNDHYATVCVRVTRKWEYRALLMTVLFNILILWWQTKRYKLVFVASDGTGKAEMLCFGQLAQCMIGKPVDQVIRTVRRDEESHPYVAGIVSQKYTFSVTVANQSFYTRHISFMVNSIIASYGRQQVIPHGGTSSSSHRSSYLRDGSTSGSETNSAISTSVRTPTTTV
ncbi:unnamed protein product, partial [Urochloa humidicola]